MFRATSVSCDRKGGPGRVQVLAVSPRSRGRFCLNGCIAHGTSRSASLIGPGCKAFLRNTDTFFFVAQFGRPGRYLDSGLRRRDYRHRASSTTIRATTHDVWNSEIRCPERPRRHSRSERRPAVQHLDRARSVTPSELDALAEASPTTSRGASAASRTRSARHLARPRQNTKMTALRTWAIHC